MNATMQQFTDQEAWEEIPVQVKPETAEKTNVNRLAYTSHSTPPEKLTAEELGVPASVIEALNYEAYVWPIARVSPEAHCLVDFNGRSIKPCAGRIYWYKTRDQAIQVARKSIRSAYKGVLSKMARKAKTASSDVEAFAALSVGDVLYSSWGYDQTNVDFMEIVAFKGKKSLVLRKIAGRSTDDGGPTGGRTCPCPGEYISEEFTKRWNNGSVSLSSYSCARPLEYKVVAGAKIYQSLYCSSYH